MLYNYYLKENLDQLVEDDIYYIACNFYNYNEDMICLFRLCGATDKCINEYSQKLVGIAIEVLKTINSESRNKHKYPQIYKTLIEYDVISKKIFSNYCFGNLDGKEKKFFDKIVEINMPECCGYDLSDVSRYTKDATKILSKEDIVYCFAIRTGGSYILPAWLYAMEKLGIKYRYSSVRDNEITQDILYEIKNDIREKIIIFDDQMNTGKTIRRFIDHISKIVKLNIYIYSPGRFYIYKNGEFVNVMNYIPLDITMKRIWSGSEKERNNRISQWINIPERLIDIRNYKNPNNTCFKISKEWKWWYDMYNEDYFPKRINPKKNTILIERGESNYILKFIGEHFFGNLLFEKLSIFYKYYNIPIMYYEGYLLAEMQDNLILLKEGYKKSNKEKRKNIILSTSNFFKIFSREMRICESVDLCFINPQSIIMNKISELERFYNIKLDLGYEWIYEYIVEEVPVFGYYTIALQSSIKYSFGYWHWLIDSYEKVYFFHIDNNWGKGSCIEIEMANFIIENDIEIDDVLLLCKEYDFQNYFKLIKSIYDNMYSNILIKLDYCIRNKKYIDNISLKKINKDIKNTMKKIENLKGEIYGRE